MQLRNITGVRVCSGGQHVVHSMHSSKAELRMLVEQLRPHYVHALVTQVLAVHGRRHESGFRNRMRHGRFSVGVRRQAWAAARIARFTAVFATCTL